MTTNPNHGKPQKLAVQELSPGILKAIAKSAIESLTDGRHDVQFRIDEALEILNGLRDKLADPIKQQCLVFDASFGVWTGGYDACIEAGYQYDPATGEFWDMPE